MMSLSEIEVAAGAIGNQSEAGIPITEILKRMIIIQPKYRDFWTDVYLGVSNGNPVSEFFDNVWPEAMVNAMRAGELGGKFEQILLKIEETSALELKIRALAYKLIKPIALFLIGIIIFFGFMLFVIPQMAQSLGVGKKNYIFSISEWMVQFFSKNWLICLLGLSGIIFSIYIWFKEESNRVRVMEVLLTIPVLGGSLKNIYFGLWSYYMALLDSAGSISLLDQLKLTKNILPEPLRPGVQLMSQDLIIRGVADSVNPLKQEEGDPRKEFPFYVSSAFLLGEKTGNYNEALAKVAPKMVHDGTKSLTKFLGTAEIFALILAGIIIVLPLVALYGQLAASLTSALSGR